MAGEATPRAPKKTHCFMLHDPETMAFAGKYNSVSHRYAALKAATKGVTDIRLRQTNTKTVHKYTGWTSTLDKPRMVKRGDREIPYYKKPGATYNGSFEYAGKLEKDEAPAAAPENAPEPESEPEPAPAPEPQPAPKRRMTARKKTVPAE